MARWNHLLIVICFLIGSCISQDATVQYSIREEIPAGSYVGNVATDSQLFENVTNEKMKRLQFQILTVNNKYTAYFRIENNTGFLWTRDVIDREKFEECFLICVLDFNVAVYDLDLSELTTLITIHITIEDYNDNAPEFLEVQNPIEISEASPVGSTVITGAAVDLDKGEKNSVQMYELLEKINVFEVRTTTQREFEIILSAALDRENMTSYEIVILAKDGGSKPLTGTMTLSIIVIDDNDNSPVFTQNIYNMSIEENSPPGTSLLKISAADRDDGDNAKVAYKFDVRVVDKILILFDINGTTGELVAKGFIDYETDIKFSFLVIAYDLGTPSKSSSATVIINVIDVNDNAPVINLNLPPGGILLSELSDKGTFVTHVEIRDLDSGKNGKVMCSVLDSYFKLETVNFANNYKVVLNRTLDHETMPRHNVTILCQDAGTLPKQTSADFVVNVEDMNDNSPVFTETIYSVSIPENNLKGSSILRVSATDRDSGQNGQVTYSLHFESAGLFVIDSFTGIISANVSLDRETQGDQLIYRVLASDQGEPSFVTTGTVVVSILDLNDNDPKFSENLYNFSVFENVTQGSEVGKVSAKDPDAGLNGTFYYIFPNDANSLQYFNFHESGLITTKVALDRELKGFHQFYVGAADLGGRSSSVLVTVTVIDINDNRPEIIYPNDYENTIERQYNLAVNSEVIEIDARDSDFGANSKLYYFIDQDNASNAFMIDPSTGKIFLNKSLHKMDVGQTFNLVIRVTDNGNPRLSSWQELNIKIIEGEASMKSEIEVNKANLWIVVGIVILTAILSLTMILIIVKIWWCNHLKGTESTSDNIMESNEVDPRLIDSSSSSTSSKDSNEIEKVRDSTLQTRGDFHNDSKKGYFSDLNETGYLTNSSVTSVDSQHLLYMERAKKYSTELDRKLDETNSNNSEDIGTRDSGQGGSDLDLNSLSELPVLGVTDSPPVGKQRDKIWIGDNLVPIMSQSYEEPQLRHLCRESALPNSLARFSSNPSKPAERKEIGKLRRSQKRVMFSDDLENSHSTGRSRTSEHSDVNQKQRSQSSFRRMLSEDITTSPMRLSRANNWLRRSADNLGKRPNNDKIYNQLPSNQIKFGIGSASGSKPMGSNIKLYLDKVIEKSKAGDSKMTEISYIDRYAFDNLGSSVSGDLESVTTTSGTYDLNADLSPSLASQSFSDQVFDDNSNV